MKTILAYVEDSLLARLQRRCMHPGNMVAADILDGCADGIQVKYCRRCGSVQTLWEPMPKGQPYRYAAIPHYWRRPDPHLWRDPVLWFAKLRHRFTRRYS